MSAQASLFEDVSELAAAATVNRPGPSHREDPETSLEAARANAVRSGSQRARVLLLLDRRGEQGATDDECAVVLEHPRPHVLGTRRQELLKLGLVEPVPGERRGTRLGCSAQVYRITPLGVLIAGRVRA